MACSGQTAARIPHHEESMIENPTAKLKPVLDETFKFAIGDVVALRLADEHVKAEFEIYGPYKPSRYAEERRASVPPAGIITERYLQECHGGVQLQYRVRRYIEASKGELIQLMFEYELVPYAEATSRIQIEKAEAK